jgi:hypothetical protein
MSATARAVVTAGGSAIILLSGAWMSGSGRPLNVGISTVHKLISVAAAVFLVATFYRAGRVAALSAGELLAVAVTDLLFLGAGISGALLSSDKPEVTAVLRVHQILLVRTVLSSVITFFLLLRGE